MHSELKGVFLKLINSKINSRDLGFQDLDCESVEYVYDSVRDFVDLYREKNIAITDRVQSSWKPILKVDSLELGILLKCSNDGSLERFVEELQKSRIYCQKDGDSDDLIYEVFDFPNADNFSDSFVSLEVPKEKIANWYMKLLEKNNVGMQTSRIFNDSRNVNLFSEEQLNKIAKYKKKMSVVAMQEYEKFINTPASDFEFEDINEKVLFDYMIVHFLDEPDVLKEKREKLIEKIVNNVFYASNLQKEFVVRMAAYEKCKKNNLPLVNIVFSDDIDALGSYFSDSNIIDFYDPRLRSAGTIKELTELIATVEHEVEHYLQDYDMFQGNLSLAGYSSAVDKCLSDYLSDTGYSDYNNNYKFREIEQYARINGANDACCFIEKYYKGDLSFLNKYKEDLAYDELHVNSLGYHLDNSNNFESRGYYNVKTMCEVFSKVPELLRYYPVLNRFFSDGKLKDWKELASDYSELNDDEKIVYADVSDYLFSNGKFLPNMTIDLIDSEKVKKGFVSMLQDDLTRKINKLFLIGRKIDNINTNVVKGMDEKKYCYDVFSKYLDSISMEYKFLVDNSSSLMVDDYLEQVNQSFKSILDSSYTMYSDSKLKLEELYNYSKNSDISENKKM